MKLFDRDTERATLRKAAKMAGSGQGRVAAVLGDAGIGKTSLIRELLANLEDGMRVLSGTCDDLGIAEPLSVLRDLAREAGFRLPGNLGDAGERLAIFSDALKAFAEHRSGTVLFVEDVHWADEATVDFLRFFARRISGHRILLVVTSRTDEVVGRTNLRRIIGEVPPDNLDRIELGPLSKGTVDRLSAEAGCNAAEVYEATAGNAFYVTELLRTGGNAPSLTLQDAVLARRDRLSPAGREALDAAAVFPRAASVMLLSELTGHDATPGIDDCVDHGLLESDGQTVAFRHALAR